MVVVLLTITIGDDSCIKAYKNTYLINMQGVGMTH